MRRLAVLALASAVLAGCGWDSSQTPSACLGGSDQYLAALESAPGEVLLGGETPISDCLVTAQEPGALASVGEATTAAADSLSSQVLEDRRGEAAVRLGYLVGAVQEGASASGGIHADLVRRLETARFDEHGKSPGPEFERAFGEGYAAGQATG
ncbi:MAG: hypothetical protein ACR2OC_12650 [Solirubrobacterales bacterium]